MSTMVLVESFASLVMWNKINLHFVSLAAMENPIPIYSLLPGVLEDLPRRVIIVSRKKYELKKYLDIFSQGNELKLTLGIV